jgi:hypothetical protein
MLSKVKVSGKALVLAMPILVSRVAVRQLVVR